MSEPSPPNPLLLSYLSFGKEVAKNVKTTFDVEAYYNFLFTSRSKLRWVEFEYCLKYPLRLLKADMSQAPLFQFPSIGESKIYTDFLATLPDSQSIQFGKKVSQLPLSIHVPALIDVGNEIVPDSASWRSVCEQISVYELPTKMCDTIIDRLQEFSQEKLPKIEEPITLTQELIQRRVESKSAIWDLFKQNTRKTQGTNERDNNPISKFQKQHNMSDQQEHSETVEGSSDTPVKFDQQKEFREREKPIDYQRDSEKKRDSFRDVREVRENRDSRSERDVREKRDGYDQAYADYQFQRYGRDTISYAKPPVNDVVPFPKRDEYDGFRPRDLPMDLPREVPRELQRELPRDLGRELQRDLTREVPREMNIPREAQRDLSMREMTRDGRNDSQREFGREPNQMRDSLKDSKDLKREEFGNVIDTFNEQPQLSIIFG
ncbi:hypothetical protein EIN_369620 [Entamoeba invadens IP1]|uniref:Uncharacterized protein n=2 Tax=Entamoeba invadens TaxID=33085 RepID=A0A0A1UBQ3_ENTIV|nr:hypothetical protein EIN_369620 [Entamoeba invadens IP1]ELP92640.1 hypothetical protein EIN_369620 [Entamoeba invadens IP1]BAN41285.1 hypothetical protein [Entamoeba invadens]|eukprot:XP_004259411.1 hypothetical protein EIN_369620 [Entamoeba invadens IP1]